MIEQKDITGIILAGGKSTRMGTDKGFLKFNGKSFIEYSIAALKPLVSQIIIVSNNPDYDISDLFVNLPYSIITRSKIVGVCVGCTIF